MPAASVSRNSTRRVAEKEGHQNAECKMQEMQNSAFCNSALLHFFYSPTYGNSAMKRARLIASVTACWLAAVQPLLRRLTILPWRLVSLFSSSKSL